MDKFRNVTHTKISFKYFIGNKKPSEVGEDL